METPQLDFHERFPIVEKDEKKKTVEEKIQEVHIDQAKTMKRGEKDMFIETIKEFEEVLDESLPGYNNYYGKVNASIKFASRARPAPHKTRMPSYGEHGQKLFNLKALAMVKKGVLVDPYSAASDWFINLMDRCPQHHAIPSSHTLSQMTNKA